MICSEFDSFNYSFKIFTALFYLLTHMLNTEEYYSAIRNCPADGTVGPILV